VMLADDHTLVRAGIRRILELHPAWSSTRSRRQPRRDQTRAAETADVLVLDLKMVVQTARGPAGRKPASRPQMRS
jgi:DNA-binding NarL/FixJ family response regulator